jgi:hypothetical protein
MSREGESAMRGKHSHRSFGSRPAWGLLASGVGLFWAVACGGSVLVADPTGQPGSASGGSTSSSGGSSSGDILYPGTSSGSSSGDGCFCSPGYAGSSSSSGGGGEDSAPPPSDPDASLGVIPSAPAGLAGFAFVINGVVQTPRACPAESWEYPTPAGQIGVGPVGGEGGFLDDTVCNNGSPPCPGMRTVLVNTSQYPVAYTAQTTWQVVPGSGQPPGVNFGNSGELSGVMNPGQEVDISSVYVGGIAAVLGSSQPFVDPDAGKYVADGATIPWPAGVAGSEGAAQMYVAEIEIAESCHTPTVVW